VPETPPLLEIRLSQPQPVDRASHSILYQVALDTPNLSEVVMHLATRIVEMEPEPNSVQLLFNEVEVSPDLLTHEGFRAFAGFLNRALPEWPAMVRCNSGLPELLFLAGFDNTRIVRFSEEKVWIVSVPASELEFQASELERRLVDKLPHERVRSLRQQIQDALGV